MINHPVDIMGTLLCNDLKEESVVDFVLPAL